MKKYGILSIKIMAMSRKFTADIVLVLVWLALASTADAMGLADITNMVDYSPLLLSFVAGFVLALLLVAVCNFLLKHFKIVVLVSIFIIVIALVF